jgi:uncharacterized membrane protein YagU involved in acid resistance
MVEGLPDTGSPKGEAGGKSMTTVAGRESSTSVSLVQRIVGGVIGGVAGGLVFGAMMAMMGMLPMVASVVGSKSAVVGFIYHMFNSVIIGIVFGLVFGALSSTYGLGALWGLVYGVIWWVLGPMILMPLLLGMGPQFGAAFTPPMLMSLMGHLVYGLITALVYVGYVRSRYVRSGETTA